jgi:triosephosphate isomerase (TIM)
MRKKIIAGNWKMNKSFDEGVQLVNEVLSRLNNKDTIVIFAPPYIHLKKVSELITDKKNVFSAAQNCYWEKSGAYTGEVSASMIKSCGAKYVIIGHSERREYFKETDEQLAKKVTAALQSNLTPVFCCGEPLNIREANTHFDWVSKQIQNSLYHLNKDEVSKIVIAYEPIWAIGTGKTATAQQVQDMHEHIRKQLEKQYGNACAQSISILYGGSCKPSNAKELFVNPDVDGGLIGGASLVADDFLGIINNIT